MRAIVLAALIALPIVLAGCLTDASGSGRGFGRDDAEPRHPGGELACPEYAESRVEVVVERAPSRLVAVTLHTFSAYAIMLSCLPPPDVQRVPADSDAGGAASVIARTYREVRLELADRVVRMAVDVPAQSDGRLVVDLVRATASWNGEPLDVRKTERLDGPRALDDHRRILESYHMDAGSDVDEFVVNSSWNRGVWLSASISASQPIDDPAELRGVRLEVRLLDPRGRVVAERVLSEPFDHADLDHGPLTPGRWRVEVETVPPHDPSVRASWQVTVRFLY